MRAPLDQPQLAARVEADEIPTVTTLESLFRLLVRTLSERQPARVHQPISINELMDSILPYRLVRRELGVDTSEDYETLLLRLCAGEGNFVQADPGTQAAFSAELAKSLPDLALLRVYGETHIVLRTDPLMAALDLPPEERYAPPGERKYPPEAAEEAGREEAEEEPTGTREDAAAWVPDPVFEANAGAMVEMAPERPAPPSDPERAPSHVRCPFCGGLLPPRMMINFCPHCGMGQDVGTCRTCGADMDVGWRYCVSCGEDTQGAPS